jgi:hypothetical protein
LEPERIVPVPINSLHGGMQMETKILICSGTKQWYFKGKQISEKEFNSNEFQVKNCDEIMKEVIP